MIRPFTVICMVLAGASGLYLYQTKHRAQVLDREIARTIRQTEQTKERIGMLRAEWALLQEPDRLGELARAHTNLRTLSPTQFVAMADMAARLPAPAPPGTLQAVPDEPEEPAGPGAGPVVAQAAPPLPAPKPAPPHPAPAAAESRPAPSEPRPGPPKPASKPVQVAAAPTASAVFAARPVSVPAGVNSAAVAPGTIGESVLRAMRASARPAPRPVLAPMPVASYAPAPIASYASAPAASYAPAAPATSLLGFARGSLPPPVPFASR